MRKIIVEITGKSGKSFDLTLNDTDWIGIGGNWNCLPGYMPATSGYMDYSSGYEALYLFNRERTIGESLSWALSSPETPSPTKMHGALDGFKSSPEAGQSGKGNLFNHGKSADNILKDHFGTVCSDITWKIKSIG